MIEFDHKPGDGSNQETQDYVIVNAYEDLVKQNVLSMAKYLEMCTCNKCLTDVCALVLNDLPPHYVTTRKGEILTQLPQNAQDKHADLTVKIVHALNFVKDSPRH
ncbi:MAG: late competence development ComFB family protein [Oscillospiraceae bacterium]|nr:late competence development ComFB family protein [Oscillospiraceae bacterium]